MTEALKSNQKTAEARRAPQRQREPKPENATESAFADVANAPRYLQASAGNAMTHSLITGASTVRLLQAAHTADDFGLTLGSGAPLQASVRGDMESRFHRDLGDVRIHTEPQAAMSAELRHANAYALGRDIAFGPGKFDPHSAEGRRLLAHELTHVLQQSGAGALRANAPSMESEADQAGEQVALGGSAQVAGAAAVGVACDEKEEKPKLDFYQTAFYGNRSWAQGKGEGVKTPEGWPVDVGLRELWATIDLSDKNDAPHSPAAKQFADWVKLYQINTMERSGPLANGVVDSDTAEFLRKKPLTRTGVTTADPQPPSLAGTVAKVRRGGTIAAISRSDTDSLGPIGDKVIDLLATRLAGEEIQAFIGLDKSLKQRMIASALRGFIAEMKDQIGAQGKGARVEARLKELLNPAAMIDFATGYTAGAVAGVVSPITDLIGLTALADVMPKLAASMVGKLAHLAGDADSLSAEAKKLSGEAAAIAVELIKHPDQLAELIEGVKDIAVRKSGELGHGAAAKVVALFEAPWEDKKEEEEKEPGWSDVLPSKGDAWQALLPGGAANMALGTAGRAFNVGTGKLKNALITTPWQKVGFAIGHVIGMVIVNVLLLVFSSGIGNAIVEASAALGKLAPVLRTVGKSVAAIEKVLAAVNGAIGFVLGGAIKKIKPLQAMVKPLGDFLERLAVFLRKILGVAKKEAAPVLTSAGAKLAPEVGTGTKVLPKPPPPAAPLPKSAPAAQAGGAAKATTTAPKPPPPAVTAPPPSAAEAAAKPAAVSPPAKASGAPATGGTTGEAGAIKPAQPATTGKLPADAGTAKAAPTTATPAKPAAPTATSNAPAEAGTAKAAPTTAPPSKPAAPAGTAVKEGDVVDMPREQPRPPSPYKFKKDAPKVTDINQGKAPTKPPTVPHEQPVPVQKPEAAAVDAQVKMKKASGDYESHGGGARDKPPVSPVSSAKKPPLRSVPGTSGAPPTNKPPTSAPQKTQPSATQPAAAKPPQTKPTAKPATKPPQAAQPKQPAGPAKTLDERIADAEAAVSESQARVNQYKAGRRALGKKPKGGDYKDLYNKKESLFVLQRAKAFPNRQILEQAEITGIKSADGTVRSASGIAGEGRIPDMVEINGSKVTGTDLKSKYELMNSIEGGVKNPDAVPGQFRGKSKVGKQHAKEDKILGAMNEGDKLVIRGRDVRTGDTVTIEVDAKNYGSEVLNYEEILPN